ncbi:MAG: hypothetical protein GOU97_00465, partial [Nanoarchaeota archaeon]|nr:hypothetical protein [Nanoarchaeota archaeon]
MKKSVITLTCMVILIGSVQPQPIVRVTYYHSQDCELCVKEEAILDEIKQGLEEQMQITKICVNVDAQTTCDGEPLDQEIPATPALIINDYKRLGTQLISEELGDASKGTEKQAIKQTIQRLVGETTYFTAVLENKKQKISNQATKLSIIKYWFILDQDKFKKINTYQESLQTIITNTNSLISQINQDKVLGESHKIRIKQFVLSLDQDIDSTAD